MSDPRFHTKDGRPIPHVSEDQMREVDRIAVEDFGLGILQMMENAGRNLALNALEMIGKEGSQEITILAGSGGNAGGGICCARHLLNRGQRVKLVLSKASSKYHRAAINQLTILLNGGFKPVEDGIESEAIREADLVVDALIGYSLRGAPTGRIATLIEECNEKAKRVLSLDLPSGMDATEGSTPGVYVKPERTMTLALPKTGLSNPEAGELILADIGIPPEVYHPLGIRFDPFFGKDYWLRLQRIN